MSRKISWKHNHYPYLEFDVEKISMLIKLLDMPISPFLFILLIYGTLRSFVAEQQNDDYWNASIISIRFFTFLSFVYTDQALFVLPCKKIHVIKLVLCTHVLWFSKARSNHFLGFKYLFWIFHSDLQYVNIAL